MKMQIKKKLKNIEILPQPDEHQKVDLGTRWPSFIGKIIKSSDDEKIRDVNDNILG